MFCMQCFATMDAVRVSLLCLERYGTTAVSAFWASFFWCVCPHLYGSAARSLIYQDSSSTTSDLPFKSWLKQNIIYFCNFWHRKRFVSIESIVSISKVLDAHACGLLRHGLVPLPHQDPQPRILFHQKYWFLRHPHLSQRGVAHGHDLIRWAKASSRCQGQARSPACGFCRPSRPFEDA